MSSINFERMSVLVVEDSQWLMSLMIQSLRAVGVGTVKKAEHGGDAIEFLKVMQSRPGEAGVQAIDMVISNWEMSPVNGLILLRWLRRHKDSPNRFMPVVMVSGYSNRQAVEEARDWGVTEFMTKPYSVDMLMLRMMQAILRPRQFVHTSEYFGPDRRRQDLYCDNDLRKLSEESPEVKIIYD